MVLWRFSTFVFGQNILEYKKQPYIPKKYVCIDYRYVGHLIEEIIREAHTLPLLVFFYLKIHSMTFTIFKERDKNKNRKMQA